MTPRVLVVLLPVLATIAAAQTQTPFLSSSSELVVVPVTVMDKHTGGFVANLEQHRFRVFDNGRLQEIVLFSNEDTPITIGLVIDNSGSMGPKMPEVIVGTTAFARLSNPDDEIFTVAFNDSVRESVSRERLTAAESQALGDELRQMKPEGQTAVYDALVRSFDRLARAVPGRKALVLLSDGGDNASRATLEDVLTRARLSNVTIYTIGLFDNEDPDRNPGVLKALAESTGGERFLPQTPSLLLQACIRIAHELRSSYTIAFVPQQHDGAFHKLRVEVDGDRGTKLSARTRPGYYAASSPSHP